MSHFVVGVILPKDIKDDEIRGSIERQLDRYDENKQVEPYRVELDEGAITMMAEFYKIDPTDLPALAAKMQHWSGNPGEVEDGKLYRLTRYNPDSKWDWWEIGGRWRGALNGQDIAPISELEPDAQFYALVTPSGEWHAKGRMGWFGMSQSEQDPDRWAAERAELLSGHADHLIAVVDCHI